MKRAAFALALVGSSACAPADSPPQTLDPEMEAAVARVKDLIAAHDEPALRDAFTAGFMASMAASRHQSALDKVYAKAGRCTDHTVKEVLSPRKITFRFGCERGEVNVTIGVESLRPHRIDYLLLRPLLWPFGDAVQSPLD